MKKIRALSCALLLLALAVSPSSAAATRFNMLASAAQTATAQGGVVAVGGISEMVVTIQCTAVSGTSPQITIYLQTSRDGGSTWFDLPHQGSHVLAATASPLTEEPPWQRNIVNGLSSTFSAVARYNVFGDYVRVAWVVSGTSPSFTFQVDAVGK